MHGTFNNIRIEGIAAVTPSKQISNMDFAPILGERRCKKQVRLTGVQKRFVSPSGQRAADLAYAAAVHLLKKINWDPADIDVLVLATQNPSFVLPSTAFFLQKRLGIKDECVVFDMNLGCSGANVGIQTVAALLQQGRANAKGLVLIGDPVFEPDASDPDQVAGQMLFGSAGSAVALQKTSDSVAPIYFLTKSDGTRYEAILRHPGCTFQMNGEAVFEFGVNDVANDMNYFRNTFALKDEDIDYYVFHQAQALMLDTIDDTCGIAPEKELRSLETYGNTNGSSVLITLCANTEELQKKSTVRVSLCGFGVGLSWSYAYLNIESNKIFPIIHADDIYREW